MGNSGTGGDGSCLSGNEVTGLRPPSIPLRKGRAVDND